MFSIVEGKVVIEKTGQTALDAVYIWEQVMLVPRRPGKELHMSVRK